MKTAYWLIKSEPYKYPFAQLLKDKVTAWDGIRSFEARNNLRAMKKGDLAFFYHSNEGKEIVGVARVKREAYADPSTEEDWSIVDFEAVAPLKVPVTLADVKKSASLKEMALVKKSRLSVSPVTAAEWKAVLSAGKTKL